jgi:hypothetical protein
MTPNPLPRKNPPESRSFAAPVAAVYDRRRSNSQPPNEVLELWSIGSSHPTSTPSTPSTSSMNVRVRPCSSVNVHQIRNRRRLTGQTQSKPVKVLFDSHRRGKHTTRITIYCGLPGIIPNRWWFASALDTTVGNQPAIRNPQLQSHPVKPSQTQSHLLSL